MNKVAMVRRVALAALCAASGLSAALKPLGAEFRPVDNKAVATYEGTPQGDLKVHLYFPPGWKKADRRLAIIFF